MTTGTRAFPGETFGAVVAEVLQGIPPSPTRLNPSLSARCRTDHQQGAGERPKARYQRASDIRTDLSRLKRDTESGRAERAGTGAGRAPLHWRRTAVLVSTIAMLGITTAWFFLFHTRRVHALNERDTIVLADFANTTNDAVFDGTLRQGLAVQFEQSPFFSLVSEQRIQQTLRLMGQPPDARLTPGTALDLCRRTESAAVLDGSIASLGSQYVLGLDAVNCHTGDTLSQEQVRVTGKEQVLSALDKMATELRRKLGESLGTLQKFDTPVEQATTPSLEALQAYSRGWKTMAKADYAAAVPSLQRAITLDPNFAMAYASLGASYANLAETSLSDQNTRKAYELRERVSERERFYIESHYHHFVTGDLEKARQVYELWGQTYPRDYTPPNNLSAIYSNLGQYDRMLVESRAALLIDSGSATNYVNLVSSYLYLDRLQEAQAAVEQARAKNLDSPYVRFNLYLLAFLQDDVASMAQQVAWSAGKPGVEDVLLAYEADTAAYSGRLGKAREFSRRAMASAEQAEEKEAAAEDEAHAALREALFGNITEARHRAATALRLSTGRDMQYEAALALSFARQSARAQALADELAKRFPDDTEIQFNYLPTIRAQLAVSRNEPSKGIEALQVTTPYELASPGIGAYSPALYPIYVRGEAYLAAHQGSDAVAEFQKILDHRGIVQNDPIGALAHLGLARAHVLEGNISAARAAYQDFLALWKDADTDIPVLKQAKVEYAKLQ